MKYLLDTHIVLWIAENSTRLTQTVKKILADADIEKCVSIVSAWEVEVKLATSKLTIVGGIDEFFKIIETNRFEILGVEKEYVRQLASLPLHHNDPFDRMLIATTLAEHLTFMTADNHIHKYNIPYIY